MHAPRHTRLDATALLFQRGVAWSGPLGVSFGGPDNNPFTFTCAHHAHVNVHEFAHGRYETAKLLPQPGLQGAQRLLGAQGPEDRAQVS